MNLHTLQAFELRMIEVAVFFVLGFVLEAALTADENLKPRGLSVRESPDATFNRPMLAALNHWSFRPAQLSG